MKKLVCITILSCSQLILSMRTPSPRLVLSLAPPPPSNPLLQSTPVDYHPLGPPEPPMERILPQQDTPHQEGSEPLKSSLRKRRSSTDQPQRFVRFEETDLTQQQPPPNHQPRATPRPPSQPRRTADRPSAQPPYRAQNNYSGTGSCFNLLYNAKQLGMVAFLLGRMPFDIARDHWRAYRRDPKGYWGR